MSDYKLLKHKDFEETTKDLPPAVQRKTIWAQVLLGTRGRTPSVKGTMGRNARWRRTPVYGNHYYMWWIPKSESALAGEDVWDEATNGHSRERRSKAGTHTILIHSIRHHDQTDQPINPGTLADYEDVAVTLLDPRFEEQQAISRFDLSKPVSLTTIKGLPGSGKTIALLYLLKDLIKLPGTGRIVYITYTARLKRAAQEFIQAQHPNFKDRVWICTLNEITESLTGIVTFSEPFREYKEFQHFLSIQDPTTLGQWRRYPQSLFTEIRAHLLGREFPSEYQWASENGDLSELSAEKYANERGVDLSMAEVAYRMVDRVRNRRFFRDQKAAKDALAALIYGEHPEWLPNLDALVIDEVQDLTLLQTALLCELLHVRMKQASDTPLVFTVAGDESQIVQPSGFDWGLTKRMLGTQLGTWPEEFEFQHQRRAPYNLGRLIDNSWHFYQYLPKQHRPSGQRHTEIDQHDDTETRGKIYLCSPPTISPNGNSAKTSSQNDDWDILFYELADKPGRALIDLTENLSKKLDKRIENSDEVLFLPREIKGLERSTVLVNGLNEVFVRARQYTEQPDETSLPVFEARRLFDEMRVALSRSTQTLILLDTLHAEVAKELNLDEIEGVVEINWSDLLDILQTEEMSPIEIIEGYLQEVEDLLERGMWQQAYRRNRRAYDFATELGDSALRQEANEQYLEACLQETAELIQQEQWDGAYERNREALAFAQQIDDEVLLSSVEYQFAEIDQVITGKVSNALGQVHASREQKQFDLAYSQAKKAYKLLPIIHDASLALQVRDVMADTGWAWSEHLLTQDDGTDLEKSLQNSRKVVELLEDAASFMELENNNLRGAKAFRVLQQRYQELPQRKGHSKKQIDSLLDYADQFITLMQSVATDPDAYTHIQRWLDEIYDSMDLRTDHFQGWASVAQRLAATIGKEVFVDQLENMEERAKTLAAEWAQRPNRAEAAERHLYYFAAFVAGIRGEHLDASAAWEALHEPNLAAEQARMAGDMHRASALIKQAKIIVPEELAISTKLLRLMEQLENKHHGLFDAEREILVEGLAHLQSTIASVGHQPEQNDDKNL